MYKIWTHNGCKTEFLQTGTDVTIQEIVTINVAHHSYSGPKRPNVTCLTRSHAFRKMNETQQVTMYFSLTAKFKHPKHATNNRPTKTHRPTGRPPMPLHRKVVSTVQVSSTAQWPKPLTIVLLRGAGPPFPVTTPMALAAAQSIRLPIFET